MGSPRPLGLGAVSVLGAYDISSLAEAEIPMSRRDRLVSWCTVHVRSRTRSPAVDLALLAFG